MTPPNLVTIEPEGVSSDLVEAIEAVLAKAQAGELSSVAIAYVYRDGHIGRGWSTPPNFATLLGSVTRLAHDMNTKKDAEG